MKSQVFAIRDAAMNQFMEPWNMQTLGLAIRSFGDLTEDKTRTIHAHPDDYELYHIAEWDPETGKFTNLATGPKMIARGKDFIKP